MALYAPTSGAHGGGVVGGAKAGASSEPPRAAVSRDSAWAHGSARGAGGGAGSARDERDNDPWADELDCDDSGGYTDIVGAAGVRMDVHRDGGVRGARGAGLMKEWAKCQRTARRVRSLTRNLDPGCLVDSPAVLAAKKRQSAAAKRNCAKWA